MKNGILTSILSILIIFFSLQSCGQNLKKAETSCVAIDSVLTTNTECFRDNFYLTKENGGSNIYFKLYEKKTGRLCLEGMEISYHPEEGLIIYADDENDYNIYIYDVESGRNTPVEIPYDSLEKYECTKYIQTWRTLYVKEKTETHYIIGIGMCDEDVAFEVFI